MLSRTINNGNALDYVKSHIYSYLKKKKKLKKCLTYRIIVVTHYCLNKSVKTIGFDNINFKEYN